ncbi:hypothetical protein [Streptomyces cyaneofuscatus]|uniref:hypothetical protein n=1 Tax=Streptomyces cyaneofuscatus TaxID=66883 RepID=UPI0036DE9925
MQIEIAVGLIGLGGAAVGALAAFLGVVYQQRHQARLMERERRAALSQVAVDALLADLEELRRHAWVRPDEERLDPAWTDWSAETGLILARLSLATLRLPHPELREMIQAAGVYGFGNEDALQEAVGLRAGRPLMAAVCGEAQKCLGYYLRGEPIPATIFLSAARALYRESITPR